MIEITHIQTGEFKNLHDKQEVADFLADRDDADQWTGHERYGALPDPTPQESAAAPVIVDSPEPEVPGELADPVEVPAAKKAKGKK